MTFKPPRYETVYFHLRPGRYRSDLDVVKMAKSRNAQVEPGTVVVKAKITVPGDFFDEAIPYVEIEFQPSDALKPVEIEAVPDAE